MRRPHRRIWTVGSVSAVLLIAGACHRSHVNVPRSPANLIREVRGLGMDPGSFKEPRGISLNSEGHLIVADTRHLRVQELSATGEPLRQWGGRQGSDAGELNDAAAAAMDPNGNLYVVDTWNFRIQKCDPEGHWTRSWAKDVQLAAPRGIAIGADSTVYVADTSNNLIDVFDPTGHCLRVFGTGDSKGLLKAPVGLTLGPDGSLYVADTGHQRILALSPQDGTVVAEIAVPEWDSERFQEGYVAVGEDGRIYATLPFSDLIHVYAPGGRLLAKLGGSGTSPGEFHYPTGIVIDSAGSLWVSDTVNDRVVHLSKIPWSDDVSQHASAPPASKISRFLSLARLCLDVLALMIVLRWLSSRFLRSHLEVRKVLPKREGSLRLIPRWGAPISYRGFPPHLLFWTSLPLIAGSPFAFQKLPPGWGSALLLSGMLLHLAYRFSLPCDRMGPGRDRPSSILFLSSTGILIALFTIGVRFYRIGDIPSGINNDVAWNGLYAHGILKGMPYTPYTTDGWGKCTLFFYFVALSFKLFGVSRLALLLPSILSGILSVFAVLALLRPLMGYRFAFATSLVFSSLAWNLVFSRTGLRTAMGPPLLALTVWMLYQAIDSSTRGRRLLFYALAGFFLGLGQHGYFSFQVVPVLLLFLLVREWLTHPRFFRDNALGLLLLLVAFLAILSPLIAYALRHPGEFFARPGYLFVGRKVMQDQSLAPLWETLRQSLLIFHDKANVGNFFNPNWPIVSRATGFFLALGASAALRAVNTRLGFMTTILFLFGLLPSILTSPDATRSTLTTVPLAILAVLGAVAFSDGMALGPLRKARGVLLAASIALMMATETLFYFCGLSTDPAAQFAYARSHTLMGYAGLDLSKDNEVYISQSDFLDTPRFICYSMGPEVFSLTNGDALSAISDDILMSNMKALLDKPRSPGKGLAFVFENATKNEPLLHAVRRRYPNGRFLEHFDAQCAKTPVFYTYVVLPKDLINEEPRVPSSS